MGVFKVVTAMRGVTIDTSGFDDFNSACARADKWRSVDASARSLIVKYDDCAPVTFVWDESVQGYRCVEDILAIVNRSHGFES